MLDIKIGLLYDFYGQLLTPRQQEVMHLFFEDDYSLSEIAEDSDVSRQAVHDMIKKSKKALEGFEERLGLVEKFDKTQKVISEISLRIEDTIDSFTKEINPEKKHKETLTKLNEIKKMIADIE